MVPEINERVNVYSCTLYYFLVFSGAIGATSRQKCTSPHSAAVAAQMYKPVLASSLAYVNLILHNVISTGVFSLAPTMLLPPSLVIPR